MINLPPHQNISREDANSSSSKEHMFGVGVYKLRITNNLGRKRSFFSTCNLSLVTFNSAKRGMTFIELIVVVTIFTIISGVVLFNFSGFGSSITLQSLAQEIALHITQAQTSAISGKLETNASSGYSPTYGVYFSSDPAKNTQFTYFVDSQATYNKWYDPGVECPATSGTECLETILLQKGYTVSAICVDKKKNNDSSPCEGNSINELSITFKRPFPDATIKTSITSPTYSDAEIVVRSSKGVTKRIVLWSTGQMNIE